MNNNQLLSAEELAKYGHITMPKPEDVYILTTPLADAVKVAIMVRQPLLLSGDPGTGKTTLAQKVAHELHKIDPSYGREPLYFHTKSNSTASDLFYIYDAISHFYDANIAKTNLSRASRNASNKSNVSSYITLQALGKAILASNPVQIDDDLALQNQLPKGSPDNPAPTNFVVVIDEIDKAPRDFPNDILNEIETYSFKIKEKGNREYRKAEDTHILIIMTSNSERPLPDAFLRRCVFFHIEFPDDNKLKEILVAHKITGAVPSDLFYANCITRFKELKEKCIDKKPATAELITWVRYLHEHNYNFQKPDKTIYNNSLTIITKSKNDLKNISE